jgi:hypothetical protein
VKTFAIPQMHWSTEWSAIKLEIKSVRQENSSGIQLGHFVLQHVASLPNSGSSSADATGTFQGDARHAT